MWKDDDEQIMEILSNIEVKSKVRFPVICPVCGKREGHIFFNRDKKNSERGGMWVWCSVCHHSVHATFRIPEWWSNLELINIDKLTSYPDYLEENKACIDKWVNKLFVDL